MRSTILLLTASIFALALTTTLAPVASACGVSNDGPESSQTTTHTVGVDSTHVTVGWTISHKTYSYEGGEGMGGQPCKAIAQAKSTAPSGFTPIVQRS